MYILVLLNVICGQLPSSIVVLCKVLFFFTLSDVPDGYRGDFEPENSVSKNRMEELRDVVRKSGLCSHTR